MIVTDKGSNDEKVHALWIIELISFLPKRAFVLKIENKRRQPSSG